MKTRVLFVTKAWSRGGTEKHIVDLIARLDASCAECIVLCMESDLYTEFVKDKQNVTVWKFTGKTPVRFLSYWLLFRKCHPDAILFVNGWLGLFPWYAYLAARLCGAKRVLAIEQLIADSPEKVMGAGLWNAWRRLIGYHARAIWRIRLAGLLSHATITVSNAVRNKLIQDYGYPIPKTVTILNGVDLQRYARSNSAGSVAKKTELGLLESDPLVLCVSNLNPQKRIDVLLDAFCIVVKNHPRAKCIILGSGPLEFELRRKTVELGLADTALFIGHVSDVRSYLEVADLFVMSSDKEGLPLSLGEAMAYGVPCIATDVGGNKEIVSHGQTGLLVKPRSPEQLAEAIDYLLAHPEERSRMGVNARRRVQEHFNIEDSMSRLKRVLFGASLSDLGNTSNELTDESR
ncbi:MAG: glycosyltransferase [Nitrospirota bacterium]|nr:glycosyltransferase [Nitrospirota bacterium]